MTNKLINISTNIHPLLYLLTYYYSYSFFYECPTGIKLFKNTLNVFHIFNKKK